MSSSMFDYGGNRKKPTKPRQKDRAGRELPDNPSADEPMKRFKASIDMDVFHAALGEHDKYDRFIAALQDPENKRYSFMRIARECHVTLHEMQVVYTDYVRHMALLQGLGYMAKELPKVMEDQTENAKNRFVVCPRCDGKKKIEEIERSDKGDIKKRTTRDCPVCGGIGQVTAFADKSAVDNVLEVMKLKGQKVPLVAIQNINNGSEGGTLDVRMDKLLQLTSNISMGRRNEHQPDPSEGDREDS